MKDGLRLRPAPTLAEIRAQAKNDLERLPEPLRELEPGTTYPVEVAEFSQTLPPRSIIAWRNTKELAL